MWQLVSLSRHVSGFAASCPGQSHMDELCFERCSPVDI